jgi:DNA-binding beta-propeller fold protein YncE
MSVPYRHAAWAIALLLVASLLAVAPAAPVAGSERALSDDYEIWALDQGEGVDTVFVYSSDLELIDEIDLGAITDGEGQQAVSTPHMIDFDSQNRYAFIASTRSGNVTVIRADDRAVVEIIPTGAGAHMAAVTPDDSALWVANIGAGSLTEITLDLDAETFTKGRELVIKEDPAYDDALFPTAFTGPVCHQFTPDGRYAYVTLGPGTGGLAVVDLEAAAIEKLFPQSEVRANCGVAITADGKTAWSNWGVPSQDEGELYRFDIAAGHELVSTTGTRGIDAHGVRLTPDESELWLVNRDSSDGIVVDPSTGEIIDELDAGVVGPVPDILDFSPDGTRAFITLRGPEPRSGAHQSVGEDPGFAVVDVAGRERIATVRPNEGDPKSDFHGIAVRALPEVRVERIAGDNRVATAVQASQETFAEGQAVGAVIARADDFPDALAGAPVAAAVGGPVLITPAQALAPVVAEELRRAVQPGAEVHVLGGPRALSPAIDSRIRELGFEPVRVAGEDRYETAALAAALVENPAVQIVTTGEDFPDALAAGAAAAANGGVVVLTPASGRSAATDGYLERVVARERVAVGGPAARIYPDWEAVAGANRVETALAAGQRFFRNPSRVALARSSDFPDALAGGVHAAAHGAPLLLTAHDRLSAEVGADLCERGSRVRDVFAYGGPRALADAVLEAAGNRISGQGCGAEAVAAASVTAATPSGGAYCHLPA